VADVDSTTGIGALILAWVTREVAPAVMRRRRTAAEDRALEASASASEAAQWSVLIEAHRHLAEDLAASRDECRRDHAAALARIAVLEAEREEDRRQIERLTAQVRDALDTLAARRTAPVD
jgi:hypothetical protein